VILNKANQRYKELRTKEMSYFFDKFEALIQIPYVLSWFLFQGC